MAFQYPGFALNAFQIARRANADASLPALTCEATGTFGVEEEAVTGDVDASLPALVAEAHGVVAAHGHADATLPTLQVEAHGVVGERKRRGGGSARHDPLPDHFYFRPRPLPVEPEQQPMVARGRADITLPAINSVEPQFTDEEILDLLALLDDLRRAEAAPVAEALGLATAQGLAEAHKKAA